jgi:hypothetical protein
MDIEYLETPEAEAITIDSNYYKSENESKPIQKDDLLFYQKFMTKPTTQKRRMPSLIQPHKKIKRMSAKPELFATLEESLLYKQ